MSSMDNRDLLEDFPPGPLDHYRKMADFDWKQMKFFFEDPDLLKIKMRVWDTLKNDRIFERPVVEPTTDQMKRLTALRLHKYCQYKFISPETGNLPYKKKTKCMMTVNEAVASVFPDVSVKYAIGISLFKNTVTTLGTERHQKILDEAWNHKILACLALTEVAHGSNTKQMRTRATFDKTTQEFIINTPDFEAAKCWIGNLGKACTIALLFAQLYTNDQCHGLHAFIVPIRDPKTLLPYPGIIIGDIGEKISLHGIDNGFIIFKNYRIPKENLLNRTGDVTVDGEYESKFSEPGKILGAALENLSTGRVGIMQESSNNLISAVTIAVRYAALRKQFAVNGDEENELPIIEYQLHQWRLFPYVSAAAVLRVFVNSFTEDYLNAVQKSTSSTQLKDVTNAVSEVHAIISSSKPMITWICRDAIQECREACGGHGFLKSANFGHLKSTIDPCVTYEGDNNVLIQQTSNWLQRQWQRIVQNLGTSSPLGSCKFLENYQTILRKKFENWNTPQDILTFNFIQTSYEWLITYLCKETYNKQQELLKLGKCKSASRNESQVYRAAVLARAYFEYNALRYYWKQLQSKADATQRPVLEHLGYLYAFSCIDKHLIYFYQGNFTNNPQFSQLIKDGVLHLCTVIKPNVVGMIDAMAPPDYVLNSVLGKSDGRLYENLESVIFHHPGAMSRPDWWHEILIPDSPDITKLKSKL